MLSVSRVEIHAAIAALTRPAASLGRCEVAIPDPVRQNRGIALPQRNLAKRCRDLMGRKTGSRDPVQQGLEQVIIAPVDPGDIGMSKRNRGVQPAEPGPDDDDPTTRGCPGTRRFCPMQAAVWSSLSLCLLRPARPRCSSGPDLRRAVPKCRPGAVFAEMPIAYGVDSGPVSAAPRCSRGIKIITPACVHASVLRC